MTKFKCQIDPKNFRCKPAGAEIAGIKKRLPENTVTTDIEGLKNAVLQGRTWCPGVLEGGAKAENWSFQQAFALDIDNKEHALTVEETLDRCNEWGVLPALIYETFGSSPELLKFRVVFICESEITDREKCKKIQLALMKIFPECDKACKNLDRIYFGGKSVLHYDEDAAFSVEALSALIHEEPKKPAAKTFNVCGGSQELEELKNRVSVLDYVRSNYGGSERRAGDRVVVNPCPVCGHNDDFAVYTNTNTWYCYGAGGEKGGSIIDFLIHAEHLTKAQAIDRLKYDICGLSRAEEKAAFRKNSMLKKAEQAGLTEDGELPPYIYTTVNDRTGEVRYNVSCPLLAEYIRSHCHYFTVHDHLAKTSRLFWYDGGVYRPINDEILQGYIKQYIVAFDTTLLKMRDVREVMQDLRTDLKFVNESELNADEDIINFQNGLLSLKDGKLRQHSPAVYSTIQIPCNYDPTQTQAPVFSRFMDELTNGDEEKKTLLLEFMGVCISNIPGYRLKKALFLYGEGDTGKSQLLSLTQRLLGVENCGAGDLSSLEERFGGSLLYQKRIFGSGDMSFSSVEELRIFKQATGGDPVMCEFKGQQAFSYVYKGLLWFCTNALPHFGGDKGDWVYNRVIAVDCNNVIPPERRDRKLLDKMYEERTAIVNTLVSAVKRVSENGYTFTIPKKCAENLARYKVENSPVRQFYNECCELRDSLVIDGKDKQRCSYIYNAYKNWYAANISKRGNCGSKQLFRRELMSHIGYKSINEMVKNTKYADFYTFRLTEKADREYGY